jgi:ABC-type nickel/cobalt efflux system permease component RcnA
VIRRAAAALAAIACAVVAAPAPAQAHPLGNFTTNQYAGVRVTPDAVDVDYVLDLAELPAFQVRRDEVDTDGSGKVSPVEGTVYAERTCDTVAGLTAVGVDGGTVPVVAKAAGFRQVPGAGGLATIRVECALRAAVTIGAQSAVDVRIDAFADRTGWREITAVGDRMTLARSSVPADTVSERLHVYPPGLAPPDVRTARLVVRPGGSAAGPAPGLAAETNRADLMTAWFGDLIGRPHLGLGVGLLALFLAVVLGAAHAVAPGHGKTLLAAYLVSQRGHRRQALWMAGTVAATHTLGVLVLAVAIAASLQVAPEAAYGWLKLASGVLVAILGASLLRRALHGDGHGRSHGHGHSHDHSHDHHGGAIALRSRTAVVMGFVGGLSPSPSAVVVLLGAAALGRAWFGVLLVVAYGVGMAATLTGIGLALARWGTYLQDRLSDRWAALAARRLPTAAATVILLVGLGVVTVALVDLGHHPG